MRRDVLRKSVIGMVAVVPGVATASATYRIPPEGGVLSLTDLGARGDGVADDTAALQKALERCIDTGQTLYVPAGSYRHRSLRIAPDGRAGLRIVGEWAFDVEQATRGSFLIHDGPGPGLELGGKGGPFPLDVEGICFVGNSASDAGVRIVGRSSLHFHRCGWIRYTNPAGMGGLHLTRTTQEFVGLLALQQCWFAYGRKGIVIDKPLSNVVNIHNSSFLDIDRCISIIDNASCRLLNVRDCHFENGKSLSSVVAVDGSVHSFNFTGNYIEQNSTSLNDPLIDIDRRQTGEISRGIVIEGNFFQKELGSKGAAIIRLNEVDDVTIRSNMSSAGSSQDRYWCWLGSAVANTRVEPPSAPNGVTPYPIFNARTGRAYHRTHRSEEDRAAPDIRLTCAPGDASSQMGKTVYDDRDGDVSLTFDLATRISQGRQDRFEIVGLPFINGPMAGSVQILSVDGVPDAVLPLQAFLQPDSDRIFLKTRQGQDVRIASTGVRLRGQARYRRA